MGTIVIRQQMLIAVNKFGNSLRTNVLLVAITVLAAMSVPAKADTIVNYNFAAVPWTTNNGTTFPADGGSLSGTLSFDWTTGSALSANLLSTASTNGSWSTARFTSVVTDGGPFTYSGPVYTYKNKTYRPGQQYQEVAGTINSRELFVDFTQDDTTDIFPGQYGSVYTTDNKNGVPLRVLASTLAASNITSGAPSSVPEPASLGIVGLLATLGVARSRFVRWN